MADWTSTTTTTWEPDWMRSTTRDRLAACRAVHAAPGRPGREKASSAAHPGEKIVPAMRNFRYAEDATERGTAATLASGSSPKPGTGPLSAGCLGTHHQPKQKGFVPRGMGCFLFFAHGCAQRGIHDLREPVRSGDLVGCHVEKRSNGRTQRCDFDLQLVYLRCVPAQQRFHVFLFHVRPPRRWLCESSIVLPGRGGRPSPPRARAATAG